jgi:hypothetical protein
VPISHIPDQQIPHYHIQVHHDDKTDPSTKLYCPCWAKCNWAMFIEPKKIIRHFGFMPDDLLEQINDKYYELDGDPDFNDWVTW